MVTAQPLAPADFNSPYASPRDAARHRSQATLAELAANRNLKDALRGFEQALIDDRTYALAAFDLGIIAAISEKWDDAVAAFEDASRLAPSTFGSAVAPQLERLRVIAKLEKSAEGRRKRAYDEALLPLLRKLPSLSASDANSALAELGRIDPKRWEAPALLAALNGDGSGYQTSSKFLEIAAANATDPAVKHALEAAHKAAERELMYNSMRADAEAADDRGDYPKAAELYQSAWSSIPARVENGLEAVSALLLCDDTEHASALLVRLRESKDPSVEAPAGAMLKELAAVEPAANATSSDAAQFFREPGPREPVRIASMIPPIDPKPLEIYMRPLPKLQEDNEPVVVLAAMAVDAPANVPLPALPNPSVAGDNPWREVTAAQPKSGCRITTGGAGRRLVERFLRTADATGDQRARRSARFPGNFTRSGMPDAVQHPPGCRRVSAAAQPGWLSGGPAKYRRTYRLAGCRGADGSPARQRADSDFGSRIGESERNRGWRGILSGRVVHGPWVV